MDVKNLTPLANVVSEYSQIVGSLLQGLGVPFAGTATGIIQLLAKLFHADPEDPKDILNKIKADEAPDDKIRIIELAVQEIKNKTEDRNSARDLAAKETGFIRYFRPILIATANLTLVIDLWIMYYLFRDFDINVLPFILICLLCTWYLIKDIRKMTSFYFGGDN